jgi:hypothetical protein
MGLFSIVAFLGLLAYALVGRAGGGGSYGSGGGSFAEKLSSFDALSARKDGEEGSLGRERLDDRGAATLLDALEKTATGAEEQLSVLKRRRKLAQERPAAAPDYAAASRRAAERFPHSAALAALAGEALHQARSGGRAAGSNAAAAEASEANELFRAYAKTLSESGPLGEKSFLPIAFALYALGGSWCDAEEAMRVRRADALFSAAATHLSGEPFEGASVDAAILNILENNYSAAAARLGPLWDAAPASADRGKTDEFLAQYAYDFGNLVRAAEIWTNKAGSEDLARAADALFLAGRTENARQMWSLLAGGAAADAVERTPKAIRLRSLYNLAGSAAQEADAAAPLDALMAESNGDQSPSVLYGSIRWTRARNDESARAALINHPFGADDPLIALELFRRSLSETPLDRSIAGVWTLLERYNYESRLSQWAAWYFAWTRRFDETSFLIKNAQRGGLSGAWLPFNRGLLLILQGDYAAANAELESAARACGRADVPWHISANRALIKEAQHDFQGALADCTRAAGALEDERPTDPQARAQAARLYLKAARSYAALGRKDEERAAVLKASALDGGNIDVRVARGRLGDID